MNAFEKAFAKLYESPENFSEKIQSDLIRRFGLYHIELEPLQLERSELEKIQSAFFMYGGEANAVIENPELKQRLVDHARENKLTRILIYRKWRVYSEIHGSQPIRTVNCNIQLNGLLLDSTGTPLLSADSLGISQAGFGSQGAITQAYRATLDHFLTLFMGIMPEENID